MDDKAVSENPIEAECHTKGDGDSAVKSDIKETAAESSTDINKICNDPESEVKDRECDLKSDSDTEKTKDLNHVDHRSSDEISAVLESESNDKRDSKESLNHEERSSTPKKGIFLYGCL